MKTQKVNCTNNDASHVTLLHGGHTKIMFCTLQKKT